MRLQSVKNSKTAVPSVLQSKSSSEFFFTASILKSSTDSLNRWKSGLLEIEVFTFAFSLCHHRHHHQQLVDKEGNIRHNDKINALIDQSVQGVNKLTRQQCQEILEILEE